MTAKRTSGAKAASAEAAEAEPTPDLELAEAPPPAEIEADSPDDPAGDLPDDALAADAAETPDEAANDDAPDEAAAEEETAEEALVLEADEAADMSGDMTGDEAAGDGAPAPGEPIRLHRRARHEETEELLAWLLAAPAGAPMTLDASEVDNVSTPYILAIVAAARARAEAGSPAVVTSPSPAFVDAFSDLGLFGDLMKMEIRA